MLADERTNHVALIGITGALGREIQAALEVEHEQIGHLFPVAGARSAGRIVHWRGGTSSVTSMAELDPQAVDLAIFATPPAVVSRHAPALLMAGAHVLDASGVLATPPLARPLTSAAPVTWPRLSHFQSLDLEGAVALALPSAATSTLAGLLDAITHPAAGLPRLERVTATVLLPASHAGQPGIEALSRQSVGLLNSQPAVDPRPFPAILAFNAVAPATEAAVLFEARTADELRTTIPPLGDVEIELTPLWIAAFSGLVASVALRFAEDPEPAALAKAIAAHPDLIREEPDDDEPDDDAVEALSLRGVLDSDRIHLGTPLFGGKTVRFVVMADPIHRTAQVVADLLRTWLQALS